MSTEVKSSNEKFEDLAIDEEASPISSRPPAPAASSSSRWPRQETLALLQIRSEMDAAFRDAATLKAPLWEYVSRKLEEQGYKRSAKKCKEKFENVHKYYKRTKEVQVGRQDGKGYKFFTQLDALHHNTNISANTNTNTNTNTDANTNTIPILPMTTNSTIPTATFSLRSQDQPQAPASHDHHIIIPDYQPPVSLHAAASAGTAIGISFSSSSSQREGDDEEEEEEEMESAQHRKRKRSHGIDSDERMIEFFEGLMRQVMQKQEATQQRFLEAIEKREQDRMIREEAWKRQDMARLAREQELMSQERAISASRDAAIIAFLQKITGQTIHLPTTVARDPASLLTASQLPPPFLPHELQQQPTFQPQKQSQNQNYHLHEQNPREAPSSQNIKVIIQHQPNTSNSEVVTAIPEQLITSQEVTSSRWPKVEVLALIQLRSGLESRYQEAGPKGLLWEDISAGMQQMGFNRNAKRCKEKWENINKYFKKVKESNKKRPEDAKTCPYFHELDALYHKKILGNTSNTGGSSSGDILGSWPEQQLSLHVNESQNKDGGNSELQNSSTLGVTVSSLSREQRQQGTIEGAKQQPEDIVRKQHQERQEKLKDYNFCDDSNSDKENEEDNDEDDVDENEEYDFRENEEEMKLAYKTQFKNRENIGSDSISIYHSHGSVRGQPASIAN